MPGASISVSRMKSSSFEPRLPFLPLAWFVAALAGVCTGAGAMLLLVDTPAPAPLALVGGPILAVGLMGFGMIGAAAAGRLWIGVLVAPPSGGSLILLARVLGMPPWPHPFSTVLALVIASVSACRAGALFASTVAARGWWIAVSVVSGEAAMVLMASAWPGFWPDSAACPAPCAMGQRRDPDGAHRVRGTRAAAAALAALAGTAAVTLLVARLWRARGWPDLLMFTAWLGLSAVVWRWPGPHMPRADLVIAAGACRGGLPPMAAMPPDPATASALARVKRQIEKWPAAAAPDLTQRARNLPPIAAVPDLYDAEPLQSDLPLLVAAELKTRPPKDRRAAILAAVPPIPQPEVSPPAKPCRRLRPASQYWGMKRRGGDRHWGFLPLGSANGGPAPFAPPGRPAKAGRV